MLPQTLVLRRDGGGKRSRRDDTEDVEGRLGERSCFQGQFVM